MHKVQTKASFIIFIEKKLLKTVDFTGPPKMFQRYQKFIEMQGDQ